MNLYRINAMYEGLRQMLESPTMFNARVPDGEVMRFREEILLIAKDIEKDQFFISTRLLTIKEKLFFRQTISWNTYVRTINPVAAGQVIELLGLLRQQNISIQENLWDLIHPTIRHVSEKLFFDGSYANAACDAFIEINDRVKKIHLRIQPEERELDGDALMKNVFSANSPLVEFCDQSTETGKNTQKGFMEMLAGAMSALRNPKAHANITISKEDAMRRIVFASMLMYKIDEAESNSRKASS